MVGDGAVAASEVGGAPGDARGVAQAPGPGLGGNPAPSVVGAHSLRRGQV